MWFGKDESGQAHLLGEDSIEFEGLTFAGKEWMNELQCSGGHRGSALDAALSKVCSSFSQL